MGWVNANRIVSARTVVEHLETVRDRAVRKLPRDAMRVLRPTIEIHLAVPVRDPAPGPQPALIGTAGIDLGPKTIYAGDCRCLLPPRRVARRPAESGRTAFYRPTANLAAAICSRSGHEFTLCE